MLPTKNTTFLQFFISLSVLDEMKSCPIFLLFLCYKKQENNIKMFTRACECQFFFVTLRSILSD